MLRVNKQVNQETASIFHGCNEFRFTNIEGHDIILAFCRTIGVRNTQLWRKVIEHRPWPGEPAGRLEHPHSSGNAWERFMTWREYYGLHQQGLGAGNFNIMRTLGRKDSSLTHYSLVLPTDFTLDQTEKFLKDNNRSSLLPRLRKVIDIDLTLLVLDSDPPHRLSVEQIEARKQLVREAKQAGWVVKKVVYDELGRYKKCFRHEAGDAEDEEVEPRWALYIKADVQEQGRPRVKQARDGVIAIRTRR